MSLLCWHPWLRLWSLLHKGQQCALNLHRETIRYGQAGFRIKGFFSLFFLWSHNSLEVAGICGTCIERLVWTV